jgi:cytochrome c oxidase assembly protein subunit 15
MNISSVRNLYTIVIVTLITIYFVIIAGSIVRSTGSGMGCPDWPKCFGNYIPPTEESQLPSDYKITYSVHGHPAVFNVYKTWTEYGNRLIGALAGIFVFIQCIYSIRFIKYKPSFFWYSLLLLFLMGFQGVLGAKVVFSFLQPLMITIHMLVALIIMGILIWLCIDIRRVLYSMNNTGYQEEFIDKRSAQYILVLIALTTFQIFLGTRVRQEIDIISTALSYQFRNTWVESIGSIFLVHRSYSVIITALSILMAHHLYKNRAIYPGASQHAVLILGIIGCEIIAGIILAYFAMPAWAQPLHLLLSTLLIGAQLAFVFRFMVGQNRRSV